MATAPQLTNLSPTPASAPELTLVPQPEITTIDPRQLVYLLGRPAAAVLLDRVEYCPENTQARDSRLPYVGLGRLRVQPERCQPDGYGDKLCLSEHIGIEAAIQTAVAVINFRHDRHAWQRLTIGRIEIHERIPPGPELLLSVGFRRWTDDVLEFDATGLVQPGPFVAFHSYGHRIRLTPLD